MAGVWLCLALQLPLIQQFVFPLVRLFVFFHSGLCYPLLCFQPSVSVLLMQTSAPVMSQSPTLPAIAPYRAVFASASPLVTPDTFPRSLSVTAHLPFTISPPTAVGAGSPIVLPPSVPVVPALIDPLPASTQSFSTASSSTAQVSRISALLSGDAEVKSKRTILKTGPRAPVPIGSADSTSPSEGADQCLAGKTEIVPVQSENKTVVEPVERPRSRLSNNSAASDEKESQSAASSGGEASETLSQGKRSVHSMGAQSSETSGSTATTNSNISSKVLRRKWRELLDKCVVSFIQLLFRLCVTLAFFVCVCSVQGESR